MILAIDQGTTGTTCLVVDDELRTRGRGYRELTTRFPHPGWVEHDADEIWRSVEDAAADAVADAGVAVARLQTIGITNQRETTVLWERASGRPVAPAIVWQDRRTSERCRSLDAALIRTTTGLVPDPYFSATKLEWLLQRHDGPLGGLCFGTVDAWLCFKLSGGRAHVCDATNASRTMLCNLDTLAWDAELCALFGVPAELLPAIVPSSGVACEGRILGVELPVAGIAGDQQAALFGHGCHSLGDAKATYGTGSFLLAHAGERRPVHADGLVATAAATASGGPPEYALEGSVFVAGAAVQWLRDGLGLIADASESEALARSVPDAGGVWFVPALTGLGAPYWQPEARGLICGITRGTRREHLVYATLEAIAQQCCDVLDAMPLELSRLRADGGATANGLLMQLQADLAGIPVEVAAESDTTALGAAALAGLAIGLWPDRAALRELLPTAARYVPAMADDVRAERRAGWRDAVARALG